ncbi:endoribonuclease L-PSP domain-containing protein [Rhizobium etli]|uniref:endoribonuclease L-PSP domain-containing protein n=1 Tax=Rhizobium etli TaxID=29449 RepID=UPI000383A5D9|nr:endoribonuclease L-PSP domain-containing protein [Rhizobium etli]AGS25587.1 endoribonuclease L-PSP domain-containing protein [Rhizobium etli bv. mimosae str. Mim1]
MTGSIEKKLTELGVVLPVPAKTVANYLGFMQAGNLLMTSGQLPLADGKVALLGFRHRRPRMVCRSGRSLCSRPS